MDAGDLQPVGIVDGGGEHVAARHLPGMGRG
jgi:hypothetical protein